MPEPISHFTLLTSNFLRLAGVLDSMAVFETVGPGSIPGRVTRLLEEPSMFLECAGQHATLRRSKTRFDSWREH